MMSLNRNNKIWFLVVSVLFVGIVFYLFSNIITYVLISFIISLIGQPFMRFFLNKLRLNRFKFGSALAALLTLVIFITIIVLFIALFVPIIIQQAMLLSNIDYATISRTLDIPIQWLENYMAKMGMNVEHQSAEEIIRIFIGGIFDPTKIGDFFSSIVSVASGFLMGLFSVLFISFFFLQEKGLFQSFILTLVPSQYEVQMKSVLDETIGLLTRYFSGIFIQITIITTYVSLALSLMGIKNALLIGFFAALVNVIPYIGPLIGAAFAVLVTITANGDVSFYNVLVPKLTKVVAVFASMQLIDNFIIQPVIFSKSVKAHPLEIFLVILIAGHLGGVMGMVLAIPVYTMLRVVAGNFLSEFKIVKRLTKNIEVAEALTEDTPSKQP